MERIFLDFQQLNGTTWFYLSFLLLVAVYFRFTRFFSLRNWDLITLFLFVPGLLAVNLVDKQMLLLDLQSTADWETTQVRVRELLVPGYLWLLTITGYFLLRCVIDLFLTRRPRLEPNLNLSGLAFMGISLLGFMMYEALVKQPDPSGRGSARLASRFLAQPKVDESENPVTELTKSGLATFHIGVQKELQKKLFDDLENDPIVERSDLEIGVARSAAILCHLLILAALILIGWQHFESPETGVGMASLYLLLPLTAVNVEKIDHLLPAVFLTWAVYAYRHPRVTGVLFGLAALFTYPLFLVPLWTGFYWKRGARRFLLSFLLTSFVLLAVAWWLDPLRSFMEVWVSAVSWKAWDFQQNPETIGVWSTATQFYRLPIFITFSVIVALVGFWPKEKNLGELIALSVALVLGVQFWYGDRGGSYIHWYLPLLLLMIFRPNLSTARPPQLAKPAST